MLRIGTRKSRLALAQTRKVTEFLEKQGIACCLEIITTKGDTVQDCGLHEIGGQGVFVRELDNAILRGEIDAAVHSMKDIPAARPGGLITAAVLPRDPPWDYLAFHCPVDKMRVIGTASTRRRAQLLRYYQGTSDIRVEPLRGNVDTRLSRLDEGVCDAVVLAEAGLVRLGYRVSGIVMPPEHFVPSPNQGTIAVVCRDTPELCDAFSSLHDPVTAFDTGIERAVMEEVGGGCFTPQGIFCRNGNLVAEVLSLDGQRHVRFTEHADSTREAREIGTALRDEAADLIKEAGLALGLQA
jgi:hydroxymethylbilane synthase